MARTASPQSVPPFRQERVVVLDVKALSFPELQSKVLCARLLQEIPMALVPINLPFVRVVFVVPSPVVVVPTLLRASAPLARVVRVLLSVVPNVTFIEHPQLTQPILPHPVIVLPSVASLLLAEMVYLVAKLLLRATM